MLAKNLAHSTILALEMVLVWIGASLIYKPPALATTLATIAGILFALPVNLTIGNLLSISSPKKIDYGTFGRQRASNTTVFASFGVQIVVVGLAAITLMAARSFKNDRFLEDYDNEGLLPKDVQKMVSNQRARQTLENQTSQPTVDQNPKPDENAPDGPVPKSNP